MRHILENYVVPALLTVCVLAGLVGFGYWLTSTMIQQNEARGLYLRFEVLAVTPQPNGAYAVTLRERSHGSRVQLMVSEATAARLQEAAAAGGVATAMLEDKAAEPVGLRVW